MLRDLHRIVLPESEWPHPLPRPCHMSSKQDKQSLRARLVSCGLAGLILVEEVHFDGTGRKILAGLFAVPHKHIPDRLSQIGGHRMVPKADSGGVPSLMEASLHKSA